MQALLEEQPDFEVVGAVSNGLEALTEVSQQQPDILLLDIEMPGLSGASVVQELARQRSSTRIIVLSAFDDDAYIAEMVSKGIAGYLTKEEAGDVVVEAVRQVARGQDGWLSQTVRSKLMALHRPRTSRLLLSRREVDVLSRLAEGMSNKEIAAALHISYSTVKNHISSIYAKLGVGTRTEALLEIQKQGLDKLTGFQETRR